MMRIIFRKEAEADLRDIISYYEDVAPASVSNILSGIYRSIDRSEEHTSELQSQ